MFDNLSIELSNPRLSLDQKLLKLCRAVKFYIPACNRVSIWLFSNDYSEMTSLICVDQTNNLSKGEELLSVDYQNYFEHILNNQFLVSSDARNCNIAKCFNSGYFDIYDIYSLLDITFTHDFKPLGIICCEHIGDKVEWHDEDLKQLKRIANMVSTFLSENVSNTYPTECKEQLLAKIYSTSN